MRVYTRFKSMRPKDSGPDLWYWVLALVIIAALIWFWWQPRKPSPQGQTPPARPALTNNAVVAQAIPTNAPARSNIVSTVTNRVTTAQTNASVPVMVGGVTNPPSRTAASSRYSQGVLEAQLAMARRGISSGSLDGVIGAQTRAAIRAFQTMEGLPATGELDVETKARLKLTGAPFSTYLVTQADLDRLLPLSDTWLGKSQQPRLDYETVLELVSEKSHAHPGLIRLLNPGIEWTNVVVGTELKVPAALTLPARKIASIRIQLAAKTLEAFDEDGRLVVHFPCSIARRVEKRPVGTLQVRAVAQGPNYTFNPEIFPESAEAKQIKGKLILQPGPNNPVGAAWIGLDLPGYGIHGTPKPEEVGRTESHGCFRLANWNAELLAKMVWIGLPVSVDP